MQDSPFERARKRLDALNDPDAIPKPPPEVIALKSTRALDDWEDLMLVQDVELWGAVDLTIAAQLVCMQEMCRDLQFRVQVLGQETEWDRWGTQHPSVHYRMWQQSLSAAQRIRSNLGFSDGMSDRSTRDANRRAKKAAAKGSEVIKKMMEQPKPKPDEPPPIAGTDITA